MTIDRFKKELVGYEHHSSSALGDFYYSPAEFKIDSITEANIPELVTLDCEVLSIPDGFKNAFFFSLKYPWNLKSVEFLPDSLEDMDHMFGGCDNLRTVCDLPKNAGNCQNMFSGCSSLVSVGSMPRVIKDCRYMFQECRHLKEINLDVEALHEADYMFSNCISLERIIGIPETVYSYNGIFIGCKTLMEKYGVSNSDELIDIWLDQGFL